MPIDDLRGNLQHLYQAYHQNMERPCLVANWEGTHVYSSTSWMGRVWTWIYDFLALLQYRDRRQQKLEHAILHIREQFEIHMNEAFDARESYFRAIQGLLENEKGLETKMAVARRILIQWHETAQPYLAFIQRNRAPIHFQDLLFTDKQFREIRQQAKELKFFLRIIVLEGHLQRTLPYLLLAKAASAHELTNQEKHEFNKFISRINVLGPQMNVRSFEKLLNLLVQSFQQNTAYAAAHISTLELACVEAKCRVACEKDGKLIEWRNTLKPGAVLSCQGKTYVLGEQVNPKLQGIEDENLIYTVDKQPGLVISIPKNRISHVIKWNQIHRYSWAVKTAKYIALEEYGRFAVIERLKEPLYTMNWKSQSDRLEAVDRMSLKPMKKLLKWWIEQEKTPLDLSIAHLWFSAKGRIKSTKVLVEGPLDFNALIQYVNGCANGNFWVYRHLVKPLKAHRYGLFYEAVVQNAVSREPWTVADLMEANKLLPNTGILAQSAELSCQVQEIYHHCCRQADFRLQRLYGDRENEEIGKRVISCYQEGNYVGMLPADFRDQVMTKLSQLIKANFG